MMARTPGATNKSEREHKQDAQISLEKAKRARDKEKARQKAEKEAKKK